MIFFLNSANRIYNDVEFNKLPGLLFSDGIFNTKQATHALWRDENGDFKVKAPGDNMTIVAKAGSATLQILSNDLTQRIIIQEDNDLVATVAANPSIPVRVDAIVLRVDQSVITDDNLNAGGSNAVELICISGNGASALSDAAISTALGNNPFIRLADISVPQNATSVNDTLITDRRVLAKMTRTTKFASDVFRFYEVELDPKDPEAGDVWFNSTQGILKMYDGEDMIALQTQSFDWGYYPPNGVDQVAEAEPTIENDGEDGNVQNMTFDYTLYAGVYQTQMASQIFKMPDMQNILFKVKMGNHEGQLGGMAVGIYTSNAGAPNSLVETVSFGADEIPRNDYLNIYLTASLYTPGNEYVMVFYSTVATNPPKNPGYGMVQTSSFADDEYLLGTRIAYYAGSSTNPLSEVSWSNPIQEDQNCIMQMIDVGEQSIGETDNTGKVNLLGQVIVAKSKDMVGFIVVRGDDIVSPTGDITAKLYKADPDGKPIGGLLAQATISESDWGGASKYDDMEFALSYDQLVVGGSYIIVIEVSANNDSNNYTILRGFSVKGGMKYYNNVDDWVDVQSNIIYKVRTGTSKKIVVTTEQGLIPENLIPRLAPRVRTVESEAVPYMDVNQFDHLEITAQGEAITSMTTNLVGDPYNLQEMIIRIKDNGTQRSITWGNKFEACGAALPANTTVGKRHTLRFIYSTASSKWGCVSAAVEA